MNVTFIGEVIGDLVFWDKSSTSEIVIGTKKCHIYKFDLFDLVEKKVHGKS